MFRAGLWQDRALPAGLGGVEGRAGVLHRPIRMGLRAPHACAPQSELDPTILAPAVLTRLLLGDTSGWGSAEVCGPSPTVVPGPRVGSRPTGMGSSWESEARLGFWRAELPWNHLDNRNQMCDLVTGRGRPLRHALRVWAAGVCCPHPYGCPVMGKVAPGGHGHPEGAGTTGAASCCGHVPCDLRWLL